MVACKFFATAFKIFIVGYYMKISKGIKYDF